MPRFFFHVFNGHEGPDIEGTDLPDLYAAQAQSVRVAGEILRDMGMQFWNNSTWRMEVADNRGQVLFVLHVSVEERSQFTD